MMMKNLLMILGVLGIVLTINRAYSQNSSKISFDTVMVQKYGQTFSDGAILNFVYQFVYPTNDIPAIKRIKDQMIQDFFNVKYPMPLEQAQRHYEKEVFELDYHTESPNWDMTYSGVKISHNKVLSFFIQQYYYGGGPHPYEYSQCQCYDLRTGNKITLQDLFHVIETDDPLDNELLCLINDQLYPQYGYGADFIPRNLALLPQGIMFIYDLYSIGCYTDGTQRVTLPLSKIRHLLKPRALTYFEN